MKILFLTSRLPFPPNRGDKLRVFNFLSRLSKNHSITLLSFAESKEQLPYINELKKYCTNVEVVLLKPWQSYLNCLLHIFSMNPLQVVYYRSKEMRKKLNTLLFNNKFDAIYVHLFRMAQYAEDIRGVKRVLDLCDAVSSHMKRTIRFNRSILWPVYFTEWIKIDNYEKKIIKKFDEVILISESDRNEIFNGKLKVNNIKIIPNGVDYEYFRPVSINNHKIPRIAFLGYLSTFYNLDGIFYFYNQIFPIIKSYTLSVRFSIIGASCPNKLRKLTEDKSVELFSDIEDTRPFLNQATVFVCPLRIGSGLQNKILEAMAMGLPVVTTNIGYKGINAEKNKEIIVADEPKNFASRVLELLRNEDLRYKISRNARSFIEKNYNWQDSIAKLEDLLAKRRGDK
ncbi:MAG: hypothetical protein A2166_00360 [Omnitrophica WOR_2 bacterium RBG_13_41_10]|nr:MAG: hypothetical protein A2166_00360 [Omnitrophica WOR_2 bacterium RBG_13_41_10]